MMLHSLLKASAKHRYLTGVGLAVGVTGDAFISDYAKELSYDHEYAREVWEHEYNSSGEIDEYIAYATSRGLSHAKAREIAISVTSEPSVSVPYHLAFELGLIKPRSYRRKLAHSVSLPQFEVALRQNVHRDEM